jgi:hypothetical protein
MKRVSLVRILATYIGSQRSKLSPDKRRRKCKQPAEHPRAEYQKRRTNLKRDHRRIHKNPRPDNATHNDHRGIEQTEAPRKLSFSLQSREIVGHNPIMPSLCLCGFHFVPFCGVF